MSLFDSIISEAGEKFGLGDKSGTMVSALLALITDRNRGGFPGFLDLFSQAGLGDMAESWISSGPNDELSGEQVEAALGAETIAAMAGQADVDESTAKSALAYLIPNVVDKLTPDGVVPEDKDLLSKIGDFLSGVGGAVVGTAAAAAAGAADKLGDVADVGKAVGVKGLDLAAAGADTTVEMGKKAAGAVGDAAGSAVNAVENVFDGDDNGVLTWLIPLILLGLLVMMGSWFCSKPPAGHSTGDANANKTANANTSNAANTNANKAANANATGTAPEADRKLTEVSLPDGKKLAAYPGGIEDQLIKFIQSDEYKNAAADTLKEKWFNFDDLNFKFGTTELVPESKRQLDNIVAILKVFPDVRIKIGGYTDLKGDAAANKKLSDDRAKAVKAALEKAGVGAQVPEAEGYGEEFAKIPETASDQERAADRKTSLRLLK